MFSPPGGLGKSGNRNIFLQKIVREKKKAVICYIKKINIEAVLSNSVPLMCFVTLLLLPIIAHGLLLLLLIITLSFI